VFFAAQSVTTRPLIVQAEVLEHAALHAAGTPHDHGAPHHDAPDWEPAEGAERTAYTLGADILLGVGFAFLDPDLDAFEVIDHPEPDFPTNRFNDGKVDPHGNFWAGTMDDLKRDRSGVLYRLGSDHRWVGIDPGYRISNGPAFSPDGGTLYHTDTLDRTTYAFDLADDGSVSNRRVFREWRDVSGNPDGMTTDAEGHLWVAFWGGWCVRRVTPAGEVVAEHALPVSNVTSMAFGGPGLDRLFVTCAHQELDADAAAVQPLAGALFEVLGHGVTGLPGGIYRG